AGFQRVAQELAKGTYIVDLAFVVAANFLVLTVAHWLQNYIQRQLRGAELFILQLAVLLCTRGWLIFCGHGIGIKLHKCVAMEEFFDRWLREHTALVNLAVRSGQSCEIKEDQLLLFLGRLEAFFQIADPGQPLAALAVLRLRRTTPFRSDNLLCFGSVR